MHIALTLIGERPPKVGHEVVELSLAPGGNLRCGTTPMADLVDRSDPPNGTDCNSSWAPLKAACAGERANNRFRLVLYLPLPSIDSNPSSVFSSELR
ncbi:hypothetical protein Enr13x_71080 [Stieleria neptunia]|uniref:Uncharacterized protein n=1 Tax=Stieleria neptunia TaxID=2527979 RepID=A0A518I267_9BACT|nr:hypothetical protein Enr13x_71080 [Stieleria neptunia]